MEVVQRRWWKAKANIGDRGELGDKLQRKTVWVDSLEIFTSALICERKANSIFEWQVFEEKHLEFGSEGCDRERRVWCDSGSYQSSPISKSWFKR